MVDRFDDVSEEEANQPAEEGKWSAIQVVSHLVIAESLTIEYVEKKIKSSDSIPMSTVGAVFRLKLLKIALRSPIRWKAPSRTGEVPAGAEPKSKITEWGERRAEWETLLESFPEHLLPRAVFRHPRAGMLNSYQTLDFMVAHVEHHVRQVDRILRSVMA